MLAETTINEQAECKDQKQIARGIQHEVFRYSPDFGSDPCIGCRNEQKLCFSRSRFVVAAAKTTETPLPRAKIQTSTMLTLCGNNDVSGTSGNHVFKL